MTGKQFKKPLGGWVNVSFQLQLENSQTKHFANNFVTKNAGDNLDFGIKWIDDKNNEIEFADGEKKFPIVNFLIEFLAWIELIGKNKKAEMSILKMLVELEKDLPNFQITVQKDKIRQCKNIVGF